MLTLTTRPTHAFRRLAAVALAGAATLWAAAGTGAGADDKTQTVDGRGITFAAPAAWKAEAPQSEMRRAQLRVEPTKGDEHGAELILFAFPGGAGSVDANVARWQGMFRDDDGNPPKVEVKTVKGQNVDVNRVEMAGHYTPSNFPGQPKQQGGKNYRLLGAIVLTPKTSYFLRMVGPDKTITAARDDFDTMIKSIKVDDK